MSDSQVATTSALSEDGGQICSTRRNTASTGRGWRSVDVTNTKAWRAKAKFIKVVG